MKVKKMNLNQNVFNIFKLDKWKKLSNDTVFIPSEPFNSSKTVINIDKIKETCSIEKSFSYFFTDEIIDIITKETNKYSFYILELIKNNLHPNKKLKQFKIKEVTKEEIKIFIGLIILMGVLKLPELRDYWSKDPFIATVPFRFFFGRDRFLYILRFLHVFDSNTIQKENKDPLIRIREFSNNLKSNFQKKSLLDKELSVDEMIIPSKGRCKFRQYIKSKRHRFGMKVWALCDASSGYIYNFNFYVGKEDESSSKNLSEKVVLNLLKDLNSSNHKIYMDAYFTSVPLFDKLNDLGYGATGVLKKNRKYLPKDINTKIELGDIISFTRGNILCFNWMDRKPVLMLTNCHSNKLCKVTKQYNTNFIKERSVPEAILNYNQYAHGVDRADQLMSYYKFKNKTIKVWKRVFFFLLEASIINSWILYKMKNNIKINGKNFRLSLAKIILNSSNEVIKISINFSNSIFDYKRLNERHFIIKNHNSRFQDCFLCSSRINGKRIRTSFFCEQCSLPFCVNCFKTYHTIKNY